MESYGFKTGTRNLRPWNQSLGFQKGICKPMGDVVDDFVHLYIQSVARPQSPTRVLVFAGGGGIEKPLWGTTKVLKSPLEVQVVNHLPQKRKW